MLGPWLVVACRSGSGELPSSPSEPSETPGPAEETGPHLPFPQHVQLAPGTLQPGVSPSERDDNVRRLYDRWRERYVAEVAPAADGSPRFRVKLGAGNGTATVSEGQGYGLVIAVYLAGHDPGAQTLFDGLWRFATDHPSEIDPRMMDWHVPADASAEPGEDDSAFDGDADLAYALLLADRQWGSAGAVDYRAAATDVIAGLTASVLGPESRLPLLGDWVDPDGRRYGEYTPRPSDLMIAHFRAFGDVDPVWTDAVEAAGDVIDQVQADHAPETGLLPDFLVPEGAGGLPLAPAPPGFLEADSDGAWSYNAARVGWRIGVDAAYDGDPRSIAQVGRISSWARAETGGDPEALHAGYTLGGEPLPRSNYATSIFVAPLAVAAMSDPLGQAWLDATYGFSVRAEEGYFEDTVTLLCLLAVGGNAWQPD